MHPIFRTSNLYLKHVLVPEAMVAIVQEVNIMNQTKFVFSRIAQYFQLFISSPEHKVVRVSYCE